MMMRSARSRCLLLLCGALACAPAFAAPDPVPSRVLGELAHARGKLGFAPCEGEAVPIVDATGGEATANLLRITGGRDGAAFAELEVLPDARAGLRIVKLRRAYDSGPRCDEVRGSYVWQGLGHEPEWELSATHRTIRIQRLGERTPWFFQFRAFERDAQSVYRYQADSVRGSVSIALTPGRCIDERTRLVSDFKAEIVLAGTIALRGCAWNGQPRS
jgi:uncharacterized membrane protein